MRDQILAQAGERPPIGIELSGWRAKGPLSPTLSPSEGEREKILSSMASRTTHHAPLSACHIIAHTHIPSGAGFGRVSVIPHDPEAFARAIYAELHQCDEEGAELIVVEAPPETSEWRAIAVRYRRRGLRILGCLRAEQVEFG